MCLNRRRLRVATALIALSALAAAAVAQTDQGQPTLPVAPAPHHATAPAAPRKVSPYRTMPLTEKAKQTYVSVWGIDQVKVNYTSSGNLIRFSYRVLDPQLAKPLSDKKLTPLLIGQRSHAVLKIPVMEKIGPLRQAAAPEKGKDYWMVFSNKGQLVKPGDRVDVVIGSFRAEGLLVE
jgi:hypothetical protein